MKSNKYEIDMCNGSIMDKLVSFALPLMLSGSLQLCSMQWTLLLWEDSVEVKRLQQSVPQRH